MPQSPQHRPLAQSISLEHSHKFHHYKTHTKYFTRTKKLKTKLHGLSPRANYTDRATAACRRNDCQHFEDRGCHAFTRTPAKSISPDDSHKALL
jgi:hypothetical protein